MTLSRWLPLALSTMLLGSAHASGAAPAAPASGDTKPAPAAARQKPAARDPTLYALGVLLSRNLESFELSEAEFNSVRAGFADGFHHRASAQEAQTYTPQLQALQRTRSLVVAQHEKQLGQTYLDKAAAAPGATKTASGLVYVPLVQGSGASPTSADRVKVHYTGKLVDGTVFDSSLQRGQPATFILGGVIPCWSEALQLMKVGGKGRVVCPSDLAYGDRGAPPQIRPGATLDFEVELLDVMPVEAPPAPAAPSPPAEAPKAPAAASPPPPTAQ